MQLRLVTVMTGCKADGGGGAGGAEGGGDDGGLIARDARGGAGELGG